MGFSWSWYQRRRRKVARFIDIANMCPSRSELDIDPLRKQGELRAGAPIWLSKSRGAVPTGSNYWCDQALLVRKE